MYMNCANDIVIDRSVWIHNNICISKAAYDTLVYSYAHT